MNILITGATGRIGRTLIPELTKKGHKIRTLIIPGDPHKATIGQMGAEIMEGFLEDDSVYPGIIEDIEAVYHLAGLLPAGNKNDDIFDANIKGTYKILERILTNNIKLKRFVFASSDEVYPSIKPRYLPLDEDHPRYPYSVYGLSKVIGEDFCNLYCREFGIPTVNARFTFTVMGRELIDESSMPSLIFFAKPRIDFLSTIEDPTREVKEEIQILKELYDKNGRCLFLSVKEDGTYNELPICDTRDLVQGLILCLEKDEAVDQAIGFGPPRAMKFDDMVKYISEKTNTPYFDIKLPVDLPYNFNLNLAKAKTLLGYKPEWDFYRMIDDAVANPG
jgi:UDP-glucose 4-epimerase